MVLKPASTSGPVRPTFTAATLVGLIREALYGLPDIRKGGNHQRYAIGDAGLSAFSVFFLQSPSFLDYLSIPLKATTHSGAKKTTGNCSGIPLPTNGLGV